MDGNLQADSPTLLPAICCGAWSTTTTVTNLLAGHGARHGVRAERHKLAGLAIRSSLTSRQLIQTRPRQRAGEQRVPTNPTTAFAQEGKERKQTNGVVQTARQRIEHAADHAWAAAAVPQRPPLVGCDWEGGCCQGAPRALHILGIILGSQIVANVVETERQQEQKKAPGPEGAAWNRIIMGAGPIGHNRYSESPLGTHEAAALAQPQQSGPSSGAQPQRLLPAEAVLLRPVLISHPLRSGWESRMLDAAHPCRCACSGTPRVLSERACVRQPPHRVAGSARLPPPCPCQGR